MNFILIMFCAILLVLSFSHSLIILIDPYITLARNRFEHRKYEKFKIFFYDNDAHIEI